MHDLLHDFNLTKATTNLIITRSSQSLHDSYTTISNRPFRSTRSLFDCYSTSNRSLPKNVRYSTISNVFDRYSISLRVKSLALRVKKVLGFWLTIIVLGLTELIIRLKARFSPRPTRYPGYIRYRQQTPKTSGVKNSTLVSIYKVRPTLGWIIPARCRQRNHLSI